MLITTNCLSLSLYSLQLRQYQKGKELVVWFYDSSLFYQMHIFKQAMLPSMLKEERVVQDSHERSCWVPTQSIEF
jgi:hypothetical protein